MRFDKIENFKIDDLLLDEGNYRFKKAGNQKDCVRKIYIMNSQYFKGLMKSIAENDIGEPLLVYRNGNENIVLDGNRRLSVLKVLYDYNFFAPTPTIKEYAQRLNEDNKIIFTNIQAQVSNDKKLVSRTVYERHSSGGTGTKRIPWNAYAAARFGFDEKIGDDTGWFIMALLSRTEQESPEITEYLDSSNFSYEVFRRLTRAAIKNRVISENIFSERGERIKKTSRNDLKLDATSKSLSFLQSMQKKEISLSRKDEGYADKKTIENYLEKFDLSPDNKELEDAKSQKPDASPDDETDKDSDQEDVGEEDDADETDYSDKNDDKDTGNGITKSKEVESKLEKLKSKKLNGLYYSLRTVSLNKHPALMYVGAWSFLEVLSKLIGNSNTPFPDFYRKKFNLLGVEKQVGKDYGLVLDEISRYGNATKHSKNATPVNAAQLANHFEVIEPLIIASIDEAIKK